MDSHGRRATSQNLLGITLFIVVGLALTGCGSGSQTMTQTTSSAPSVSSISPAGISAGAAPLTLNVKGSNFEQGSTVNWNGNSRTTTFISSTQLQAHIMAADLANVGKVPVTVANPEGGASNPVTFTVAAATITFESSRALDGTDAPNTNFTENIWSMNADGSSQKALTKQTAINAGGGLPQWSPDGGKVLYASRRALDGTDAANTAVNVWMMNADGSGQTPITRYTVPSVFGGATWSPDGTKIAFSSSGALDGSDSTIAAFNLWVANADGSNAKPLTRLTAAILTDHIAWSPDSSKIAFSSTRALDGSDAVNSSSVFNVWVINADGSAPLPLTRLTVFGVIAFGPSWSPDGSKIAYPSSRALDGSNNVIFSKIFNIWLVNADGSGNTALTKLTAPLAESFSPLWSPDGTRIAFASRRALDGSDAANATLNIWIMNADGSAAAPLTKITVLAASIGPAWTSGGDKILFASQRALNGSNAANTADNIWVMNADGSNATPLTTLTASGADSDSPDRP